MPISSRRIPQPKLLPCPFCGSNARDPVRRGVQPGKSPRPVWEIECGEFCVVMRRGTKMDVVRDWNRRVSKNGSR